MYYIHSEQCDRDYVGETSQLLETRVEEHISRNILIRQLFMTLPAQGAFSVFQQNKRSCRGE